MKLIIFDWNGKFVGVRRIVNEPRTALHPMLFVWHWLGATASEFYQRPTLIKVKEVKATPDDSIVIAE